MLRGLLTLQINTIERVDITAEQVPALPHALLDIAYEYLDFLQGKARLRIVSENGQAERLLTGNYNPAKLVAQDFADVNLTSLFGDERRTDFSGDLRLTPGLFEVLRLAASQALKHTPREDGPDQAVLRRICNNCDSIKVVLKKKEAVAAWLDAPARQPSAVDLTRPPPSSAAIDRGVLKPPVGATRAELVNRREALVEPWFAVLPNDALIVRHTWEIGTEIVRAQTVVQLRGDIVTRLHPTTSEALRTMHQLGVGAALGHWHQLMALVVQIGRDALGSLTGRGR
ncbi:hypothetical protein JMJ56_31710 [Belnapia sp. T18]|uniref:Uncharacterized protein n=1 Tax=Belnapia arida TaxID=2804533 RepID=A0ABS1UCW2_9PROT|nr:hypothetical protein [Belnapia arida]MBL6082534.1 hypothetical protein [Belnapia arida]